MKRLLLITVILAGLLTGCGTERETAGADSAGETDAADEAAGAGETTATDEADSAEETAVTDAADSAGETDAATETGSTNILIAYFSAAENSGVDAVASASYSIVDGEAVGRLAAVADMISDRTGGELFSIRTSVVYPADGGELIDYAAQEQDEDARPELTSHIEDPARYDTIFIGFAGGIIGLNQEKPQNQGFALI